MNKTIIKLPRLLSEEVYGHTVETGLVDHRSGNSLLDEHDLALYEKLEKDCMTIVIESLGEAVSLYNELYNLVDFFDEWAESEGVYWLSVKKAALARMKILKNLGLTLDSRGWARL